MRVIALLEHLFVRYPVPFCLYKPMLSAEGLSLVNGYPVIPDCKKRMVKEAIYRRWFHTISRGDSFADLTREFFSRREAHWFIKSPTHLSITQCMFWAKAAAAGVPPEGCDFILDRFGYDLSPFGDQLPELFQFYARTWDEFDPAEHAEIADYIRHRFFEGSLSLTGRSARSVQRLCEEWHEAYNTVWTAPHITWRRAYEDWTRGEIQAVELTGSRELVEESSCQRHCVSSYSDSCVGGYCRIVSMRWFRDEVEFKRLTFEIRPERAEIVQIRGRFNRHALPDELAVIRQWAVEQGLTIASFA